jgi:hypothetical protein
VVVEEIMKKTSHKVAVATLALMLTAALGPPAQNAAAQVSPEPAAAPSAAQVQQPNDGGVNWPGAGYGVGALLCNFVYLPAKLVYAVLGGFFGGGAYLVTGFNQQVADPIWRSALGGDYVVTPQMLAGEQPIYFSGPTDATPENAAPAQTSSSGAAMTTTASSGTVAPIAPLPPTGVSAAPSGAAAASGSKPLDHGSGPEKTNIE